MASIDFSEGRRYLAQFSEWAKRNSIKLVEEEEFSRAQVLMDRAERVKRIEKDLEGDSVWSAVAEESERRQSSEEESVEEIQGKYPHYFTRDAYLVKQGLNRDKKDVYEQKVPRREVGKIFDVLANISRSEREFEINNLLGAFKAPKYQLYIVLGVLQEVGLLKVPRRGAYSFVDRERFSSDAESLWKRIPTR